ncbi:MAG: deoxyribonuclease V [Gammaproteobacteria bacterium]|nr:deoxyribonuclease V [Gammaproteobacteria bacterium]MBU1656210.1 deoxyribonuclease V [Gammaproteobacteria bacterium]MBU1959775.1 deoxyribonuclease V [Gammaproteobacteria bacterium]
MNSTIKQKIAHQWDLTPAQAVALQKRLRDMLVLEDRYREICCVAGVDVGFEQGGSITRAAVTLLAFPSLKPLEKVLARTATRFPYIPGLLSFRELPAVLEALALLKTRPDLLLCDGQGYAHPRRFGIACHLGLLTQIPSIGVAKSRLIGQYVEPLNEKGACSPLMHGEEVIGAILRTRKGVKPLYVSAGHLISLSSSIRFVMGCITGYRLPETTRSAHQLASLHSEADAAA